MNQEQALKFLSLLCVEYIGNMQGKPTTQEVLAAKVQEANVLLARALAPKPVVAKEPVHEDRPA